MDIAKLTPIEYRYIFDIDQLKEACILIQERQEIVSTSPYFSKDLKEKVYDISADLLKILNMIINRQNINCFDDYNNALDSAILANADIQIMVCESTFHQPFGRFKKSHPLYRELLKWKNIQTRIGVKEWSYLINQNHSTAIAFLVIVIGILVLFIIGIWSMNVVMVLCVLVFMLLTVVFTLKFNTQIETNNYMDQLYRMKNYTHFKSKEVLKSRKRSLFNLLSIISKKL